MHLLAGHHVALAAEFEAVDGHVKLEPATLPGGEHEPADVEDLACVMARE